MTLSTTGPQEPFHLMVGLPVTQFSGAIKLEPKPRHPQLLGGPTSVDVRGGKCGTRSGVVVEV